MKLPSFTKVAVSSILLACCATSCVVTRERTPPKTLPDGVQTVVDDLCNSRLVFLGEESSHGGGVTTELKSRIVAGLIEQCDFQHVVFESQIYDFEDLKQRYRSGSATKAALYDAIGGLWSTTSEIDGLVDLLHRKAQANDISISGIDGQVGGSTGIYTQRQLGNFLVSVLPEERRVLCESHITRLTTWSFDKQNPYNDSFKNDLKLCANEIQRATLEEEVGDERIRLLSASFSRSLDLTGPDKFNRRDLLMHDNLHAILKSLPLRTKSVVWTANVHALRTEFDGRKATASHVAGVPGDQIKSVGIVATTGTYGRFGQSPITLEPAKAGSFEGSVLDGTKSGIKFIPASQLPLYDNLESRLLGYSSYRAAEWSKLFDSVVVLGSERQPNFVRNADPMQATDQVPEFGVIRDHSRTRSKSSVGDTR